MKHYNNNLTNTYLNCYGYHSCYNRNPVMTTEAGLNCYGSYSCYSAQGLLTDDGHVYCNGLSGCERVESIESEYSQYCYSERFVFFFVNIYKYINIYPPYVYIYIYIIIEPVIIQV